MGDTENSKYGLLIKHYTLDVNAELERVSRIEDKAHNLFGFNMSIIAVLAGFLALGNTLQTNGTSSFFTQPLIVATAISVVLFMIATLFSLASLFVSEYIPPYSSDDLDEVMENLTKTIETLQEERLYALVESFVSIKARNKNKSRLLKISQIWITITLVILAVSVLVFGG